MPVALTQAQRVALEDSAAGHPNKAHRSTLEALERRGLVALAPESGMIPLSRDVSLTPLGRANALGCIP